MKFYDTCALLKKQNNLFDDGRFMISSITLKELEYIKTSNSKDEDTKFAARRILFLLDTNPDKYEVSIFQTAFLNKLSAYEVNNDLKILSCALANSYLCDTFVTNDLSLKAIAHSILKGWKIESVIEKKDNYTGYKNISANDEKMAEFYSNPNKNTYNLYINEYINILNSNGDIVDTLVWTGETHRHLNYRNFNSQYFGDVKPWKGDPYQAMVADSFMNNSITVVRGPAGSGKTYLSLGYLLSLLDHGKIDRIIVFCNTVAAKNSAKLGYLPGTREEKLLDSQIGNLLISKIGGRIEVERLMAEEKLILLPLSDIRGYDTTGMNAGVYISEAQNLDIELMRLALQRIGQDSICIIDGDSEAQVDLEAYEGRNNGMKRLSQVFRGHDFYGEISLQSIHRSKIANLAQLM